MPRWLGGFARMATAQHPPGERSGSRLPFRVTRAQKVLAGATLFGILVALLIAAPPLPWPLRGPQELLRLIGLSAETMQGDGVDGLGGAYVLTMILQANLFLLGAVWMWLVLSWRLARSPLLFLCGMVMVVVVAAVVLAGSPLRMLVSWIVVALLSIAYIHYYRKGRFGYTRGAAAAVFSHIALICFFVSLPIVLAVVLVDLSR